MAELKRKGRKGHIEVAVVILNYNGERWLRRCLDSAIRTDYANFHVMVVDNGSTDGSLTLVREEFPAIETIGHGRNLGFCEGNNVGIRLALERGSDYVVLLNPDTWVEPDWLRELIEVGESNPDAGIVGAVQLGYEDDRFNSWTEKAFPDLLEELRHPAEARPAIPVEWVEGACLAVKRGVLETIGLLDPIYFAFYEEIDLCRRARAHGYEVLLAPRSRIHHFRGGSWEVDDRKKRERDYRCDRSQFIYNLTDARKGLGANLAAYLQTLATKGKEVWRERRPQRGWDLLVMQFDLLTDAGRLLNKWKRERATLRRLKKI